MNHFSLWRVLGMCLCLTAVAACVHAAEPSGQPPEKPAGIQGVWVWRSSWIQDADARAELLRSCQAWGINRILMQVHYVRGAATPTLAHPDAFAALIAEAADRGIAVEALDGAKDMAVAANQSKTLAALDALLAFNASLPEGKRLVGMHYDIEPYIMPEWKASDAQRQVIMHDLLTFYQQARTKLDAAGLTLAADIPFWYDNKTEPGDSCMITFQGEHKNLHQHIQDVCDYIGIMSYRRHAVGPNSVVAHVMNELEYAEQIGKTITPALETIELKDVPTITFFGSTPEAFWTQHNLVREALADRPGFGGMLTHAFYGLRNLLGPVPATVATP